MLQGKLIFTHHANRQKELVLNYEYMLPLSFDNFSFYTSQLRILNFAFPPIAYSDGIECFLKKLSNARKYLGKTLLQSIMSLESGPGVVVWSLEGFPLQRRPGQVKKEASQSLEFACARRLLFCVRTDVHGSMALTTIWTLDEEQTAKQAKDDTLPTDQFSEIRHRSTKHK